MLSLSQAPRGRSIERHGAGHVALQMIVKVDSDKRRNGTCHGQCILASVLQRHAVAPAAVTSYVQLLCVCLHLCMHSTRRLTTDVHSAWSWVRAGPPCRVNRRITDPPSRSLPSNHCCRVTTNEDKSGRHPSTEPPFHAVSSGLAGV